jgi:hypothetical protein
VIAKGQAFAFAALTSLGGCGLLLGESFVSQEMVNPKTGEHVLCHGHEGRGAPTMAELDSMNACVAAYEAKGFRRTP